MSADRPAPVRVRIAPSPTGFMHVGTARTAIFDWLAARSTGGQFVLRVEDTDQKRFVEGSIADVIEGLHWLGINPDEGPGIGGSCGPYLQSERLDIYRQHTERLLEAGHAYRCFCPPRPADAQPQDAGGRRAGYDRRCRALDPSEVAGRLAAAEPFVVRLKMPLTGSFLLQDLLRGDIRFEAAALEDTILIKSDGYPTCHFAVVVDDHLMSISHVMRGEEWIPSSPIQIQLYKALGWPEPIWVHLPLVLNPPDPETGAGRGKMSKRFGDTSLLEYRAKGYLPEAMFNYLALLGWSFSGDQDLFSPSEAQQRFRVEDIKPSAAYWNQDKLDWMNGIYMRRLVPEDLALRLRPFFVDAGIPATEADLRRLVPLVQERIGRLDEAVPLLDFFWSDEVSPAVADLIPRKMDAAGTRALLAAARDALAVLEPWTGTAIEDRLRVMAESLGLKPGQAFQPLRVAVTGRTVAPPLFETLSHLERATVLQRLDAATRLLTAD